jgi:hypothetical protein
MEAEGAVEQNKGTKLWMRSGYVPLVSNMARIDTKRTLPTEFDRFKSGDITFAQATEFCCFAYYEKGLSHAKFDQLMTALCHTPELSKAENAY